jgi:oxygen-independent coproporphyrinogen-3 oxidase
MDARSERQTAELERLADTLGPDVVSRGVLQYFYGRPFCPPDRLSPREVARRWTSHVAKVRNGLAPDLLSLYVHIPFCRQKCRYCIYYSEPPASAAAIDAYLERLHAEIDFLAPSFVGLSFCTWYIGGGTPTILDEGRIERLVGHMDRAFPRREGGQWAFECSPQTITERKARLFHRLGFNRVSFGIQTMNREVLTCAGRGYQTRDMVRRAFEVLGKGRFAINVDLMYGLRGDSTATAAASLREVLALGPDQVTLYEVSPSTPGALARHRRLPLGRLESRLSGVIARAGYRSSAGPTSVNLRKHGLPPRSWRYNYSDMTAEPYSLLGIGPTARSYIYGALRVETVRHRPDDPFDPDAKACLARKVTLEDEQRRYAIHELETRGRFSREAFASRFGLLEASAVGPVLLRLERAGRLRIEDGAYGFAPGGARDRFVTALHLVDRDTISLAGPSARLRARECGGAPDGRVVVAAGRHRVELFVDQIPTGEPAAHRCGDFGFYLPPGALGAGGSLGPAESKLLRLFETYFDRIVGSFGPESPRDLVRLLGEHRDDFGRSSGTDEGKPTLEAT